MVDSGRDVPSCDLLRRYRLGAGLTQEAACRAGSVSSIRAISDLRTWRQALAAPGESSDYWLSFLIWRPSIGRCWRACARRRVFHARRPIPCRPADTPPSPPTISRRQPSNATHQFYRARAGIWGGEIAAGNTSVSASDCRCGRWRYGKTRLALCVADSLVTSYPEGVRLVELAALVDAALVPQVVASALGLREEPGRSLPETMAAQLRSSRMLLVLDNCEHLIAACAGLVALLLRGCPQLHVLATSREGLRMPGELIYRVPSLSLPDAGPPSTPEHLLTFEAIQLFVERARERRADFSFTRANADAVVRICRQLDGMPLALGPAAQVPVFLSAADIAARLDDRFRLLTGGPRTVLPRQQTLLVPRLDWRHDLLSPPEHALLRRLTVFLGGATLAAAEALCVGNLTSPSAFAGTPHAAGDGARSPALVPPTLVPALLMADAPGHQEDDYPVLAKEEVLDLLDELVHKSLVLSIDADRHVRYRLLETVRQYGLERLEAAGETAAMRDRHLAWYLALAIQAEHGLAGPEQGNWLALLERELDNLRAALSWSLGQPGALRRLVPNSRRAFCCSGRGMATRPRHAAGWKSYWRAALARRPRSELCDGSTPGALAGGRGDYAHAARLLEESLILQRALADQRGIAMTLQALGFVALNQGANHWAVTLYEESLALRRAISDPWGIAAALGNLGQAAYLEGEYDQATMFHEESLALRRELGNQRGIAVSLSDLGLVAWSRHDYDHAAALHEESLALRRDLGDMGGVATSLTARAEVAIAQGEYGRAAALLSESVALAQEIGDQHVVAFCLENLAIVAGATGAPRHATMLFGAAEALRERLGAPLPSPSQADYNRAVAAVRAALGESIFTTIWSQGRALPSDQAVALALAGADHTTGADGSAAAWYTSPVTDAPLSPTEAVAVTGSPLVAVCTNVVAS